SIWYTAPPSRPKSARAPGSASKAGSPSVTPSGSWRNATGAGTGRGIGPARSAVRTNAFRTAEVPAARPRPHALTRRRHQRQDAREGDPEETVTNRNRGHGLSPQRR